MPILDWIGKEKVINHHMEVPFRVLEPSYTYGEDSGNMIIHGDNLSALKSLLPRYEGKIRCIYIDPPYNTGNEGWVYNDNVNDPRIRKWLGEVVGTEGEDLSRHDKWLCMMYPRLKLLHRLLAEGGVIFISIDDNEYANLKMICDEIFGTLNYLSTIIWEKADSPRMDAKTFSSKHDFILVYCKNVSNVTIKKLRMTNIPKHYDKIDVDGNRYYLKPLRYMGNADSREDRPNLYFPITSPTGEEIYPIRSDGSDGRWRWSREKVKQCFERLEFIQGRSGTAVYTRIYADSDSEVPIETIWYNSEVGSNRTAMASIKKIFVDSKPFDTPKPVNLIEKMIQIATDKDSIILDSFAGSGTTAHAVLNMNKHDGGNRKFILIEMCDYADSITAERVKRVINGYGEGKKTVDGTGGGFTFYELGETLLNGDLLNENVGADKIREYVYFTETKQELENKPDEPHFMGKYLDTAYYFYYEKHKITALDWDFLETVTTKAEAYVIYADKCLLSDDELEKYHIHFKKIPRDITKL